ncbi:hypothetical protein, partial [Cohnella soli]
HSFEEDYSFVLIRSVTIIPISKWLLITALKRIILSLLLGLLQLFRFKVAAYYGFEEDVLKLYM